MRIMKAFVYWWGREDVLFASAVLPAALMWIQFESMLVGIFAWALSYAGIVGLYEFLAAKRNWPHAAITDFLKELSQFYNPQ